MSADEVVSADEVKPWLAGEETLVADMNVFRVTRYEARSQVRPDVAGTFARIHSADWVNVIAVTPDEHIVLVEQFRHGIGRITLEIPGGMVDPGESFVDAARRELSEETGYAGTHAERIGVMEPNPAIMSNRCATVVVSGVSVTSEVCLDPNEEILVRTEPLQRIPQLIADGTIRHSLVIGAFYFFERWRSHAGAAW